MWGVGNAGTPAWAAGTLRRLARLDDLALQEAICEHPSTPEAVAHALAAVCQVIVPALADLAISLHFEKIPALLTGHPGSRTNSYVLPGDHLADAEMTVAKKTVHWYFITGLDVVDAIGDLLDTRAGPIQELRDGRRLRQGGQQLNAGAGVTDREHGLAHALPLVHLRKEDGGFTHDRSP